MSCLADPMIRSLASRLLYISLRAVELRFIRPHVNAPQLIPIPVPCSVQGRHIPRQTPWSAATVPCSVQGRHLGLPLPYPCSVQGRHLGLPLPYPCSVQGRHLGLPLPYPCSVQGRHLGLPLLLSSSLFPVPYSLFPLRYIHGATLVRTLAGIVTINTKASTQLNVPPCSADTSSSRL
jgi:hypothetical protein